MGKSSLHAGSFARFARAAEIGASEMTSFRRTTPHLLLCGEPGTGKSQLLQAAMNLAPRVVQVTGNNCTAAGLTASVTRNGQGFELEAGALVLASGGLCVIDEFGRLKTQDLGSIHEAMEQQTVSVAKAGIKTSLLSRCSVVAAMNYKRTTDIGLEDPMLSRFDLVVTFKDPSIEEEMDRCDFVLGLDENSRWNKTGLWDDATLKKFLQWAKRREFKSEPTLRAKKIIEKYFQKVRTSGMPGRTVRTLESLQRLCEAHAKLMGHDCIEEEDAICVVQLYDQTLRGQQDAYAVILGEEADVIAMSRDDFEKTEARVLYALDMGPRPADLGGDNHPSVNQYPENDAPGMPIRRAVNLGTRRVTNFAAQFHQDGDAQR
eukprot:GEMP01000887.1.p2 GENE.GEMP01000887.1~~GEMP01000887.1.p2  ORF type:complete len:375 (+),score=100.65 GEMP01000887.1:1234-2358(+)